VKTMGSTEKFCLRWNDFEANISSAFRDLKEEKDFSDVTLVCADQQVEAHKVILAACSPFFKNILGKVKHNHPLIYMKGVKFSDLEAVLSFIYHGEVNVAETDLQNFLLIAEELELKGLTRGKNSFKSDSNHPLYSKSSLQPHPSAPVLPRLAAQVSLKTSLKTEQVWSTSENENAGRAVPDERESESSQLVNTSEAPVEVVDQNVGYEDFRQEKGDDFDLNNHIEKISNGVNFGQFKCKICGNVSSQKCNLQRHLESKHFPGLFQYSCDLCEKTFNTKTKYHNHRRLHHSNK